MITNLVHISNSSVKTYKHIYIFMKILNNDNNKYYLNVFK